MRLATSPSRVPAEPVGHDPEADLGAFEERVLIHLAHAPDVGRRGRAEAQGGSRDRQDAAATVEPRRRAPAPAATRAAATSRRASAPNMSGAGSPLTIRQLGSTIDDPSVHHNIERVVQRRQRDATAAARTPAPSSSAEPIGNCQLRARRRRGRAAATGSSTTGGGTADDSSVSASARDAAASKLLEIDLLGRERVDRAAARRRSKKDAAPRDGGAPD